jgi:hypothetical protein
VYSLQGRFRIFFIQLVTVVRIFAIVALGEDRNALVVGWVVFGVGKAKVWVWLMVHVLLLHDLWLLPMERSTHCILKRSILLLRNAMRLPILMLGGCGCLSIADKLYDGTSNSQER